MNVNRTNLGPKKKTIIRVFCMVMFQGTILDIFRTKL